MFIPDQSEAQIERMMELYEECVCMGCSRKVDYQLMCASPIGDGPALCAICLGLQEPEQTPNV